MLTPGNVDDREPLRNKSFIEQIFGKLVGDKGYICKDLFSKLFVDGIQLVTKLKSNMKGQIMTISDRVLLRKRAPISAANSRNACAGLWYRHPPTSPESPPRPAGKKSPRILRTP